MASQLKSSVNNTGVLFPELNHDKENNIISGWIDFQCYWDPNKKNLYHNSNHQGNICDSYKIKIDINSRDNFSFPKVFELSTKIKDYAQNVNKSVKELHINPDYSFCLGIYYLRKFESIQQFIRNQIIPFLYWQSHLRKFKESPWDDYSHAEKGIMEALKDQPKLSKGNQRNQLCLCGSGMKFKKCCLIQFRFANLY